MQVLADFAKKCPIGAVHMLPALAAGIPACTVGFRLQQVVLIFEGIARANSVWPHVPASTASDMLGALINIVERAGLSNGGFMLSFQQHAALLFLAAVTSACEKDWSYRMCGALAMWTLRAILP